MSIIIHNFGRNCNSIIHGNTLTNIQLFKNQFIEYYKLFIEYRLLILYFTFVPLPNKNIEKISLGCEKQ